MANTLAQYRKEKRLGISSELLDLDKLQDVFVNACQMIAKYGRRNWLNHPNAGYGDLALARNVFEQMLWELGAARPDVLPALDLEERQIVRAMIRLALVDLDDGGSSEEELLAWAGCRIADYRSEFIDEARPAIRGILKAREF